MSTKTVMVVDDSEADLLFTRIMLERCGAGFGVCQFESAPEALRYLQQDWGAVGLILLDINMPRMNGWEFLEAYGELVRDLASGRVAHPTVVMLSSSPDPDDQARALASPWVRGYIEKPLDLAQAAALDRYFGAVDVGA